MTIVTTTRASQGFKLTITGVTKTYNTDCFLNVYRRQENILYKIRSVPYAANVASFSSKPLLSKNVVHVNDRSSILPSNRIIGSVEPIQLTGQKKYNVPTDQFLVTDKFLDDDITKEPLFFYHTLSNIPRDEDGSIDSDYLLTDVKIVDDNFSAVNTESLKIDYDTGIIYNNLESTFDRDTGQAEVYYASYSVKDYNNLITSYVELISNDKVLAEADYNDLDSNLEIISGHRVYSIREHDASLEVTLPTAGTYSFKLLEDARLKLLPPPLDSDANDSWNVSVTNNKLLTTFSGITYKYSVPEFPVQDWDPTYPSKAIHFETAAYVSEKLVKVRNSNLNTDVPNSTISGIVELFIYDENDKPIAAYTNSGIIGGISYNSKPFEVWNKIDKTGIRSIDKITGFIDVDGITLKPNYKYLVNYFYNEKAYQFTDIEFNPVYNPSILDTSVGFFIDPDFNESAKTKSLYYTVFDKSGRVIKSDIPEFDNSRKTIVASDGFDHPLFYENYPEYFQNDNGDPTIPGAMLFMANYTLIGSGVLLPLGEVTVTDYTHLANATDVDARTRGGGLIKEEIDSAKLIQPETDWYWDLSTWDGMPFPGTASYYVEVPATLLEACGGTFKTDQIQSIIERHTAGGVYPIVKAYGIDPTISGLLTSSGSISIGWQSYKE